MEGGGREEGWKRRLGGEGVGKQRGGQGRVEEGKAWRKDRGSDGWERK